MTKNFKEIKVFNWFANQFFSLDPKNEKTKVGWAIKRVNEKSINTILKDYNEELGLIAIDNCHTDKDGVIVYDTNKDARGQETRQYRFKKEGLKNKMKQEKDFIQSYNEREFEIDSYIATELPKGLTEEQIDAFDGFVLNKEPNCLDLLGNGNNTEKKEKQKA